MEYHIENKVVLDNQPKYPSLYPWSLSEVGEPGARVATDQIPWEWSLYFTLFDIELHLGLGLDPYTGTDKEPAHIRSREYIRARLRPGGGYGDNPVTYSMFGTSRSIEDMAIKIQAAPEGVEEHCRVWGVVSYTTDHDFRMETSEDCLGFELVIPPEQFALIAARVASKSVARGVLRLGGTPGFYSEWSPSISTSRIKVLTNDSSHPVGIPEGCEIEPPRLKLVPEFDLSLVSETVRVPEDAAAHNDDEPQPVARPERLPAPSLLPVLKSLRIAGWMMVALLVVIALERL